MHVAIGCNMSYLIATRRNRTKFSSKLHSSKESYKTSNDQKRYIVIDLFNYLQFQQKVTDFQRNQIIPIIENCYLAMQIQSTIGGGSLFRTLTHEIQVQIGKVVPCIQSAFFHGEFQNAHCRMKLINNTLVMNELGKDTRYLLLNFDVKFQVVYEEENNVLSHKLGIRLYDGKNQQITLYSRQNVISEWSIKLEKKINQKGFHAMFKPVRKLGKGNYATVYEAERLTDHKSFAVKAFSKQNTYCATHGKESLINQLSIMRELSEQSHPNVLKLQAVFESENSIYVVLELLTGQTLLKTIQLRRGQFSEKEVRSIMSGLLSGLDHISSHRIMHRDLKPENIMMRGDSMQPVIVDFGLASNSDLQQYLFFKCGTPGYVAPEIIQMTECTHVEPICDMFSLGAIFHILLVKRHLFEGTKYDQVYNSNKELNFKLEGHLYRQVQGSAFELLKEMLDISPQRRICPSDALNHQYFKATTEMQIYIQVKSGFPSTETNIGLEKKKKKKKRFFLF